MLKTKKDIVEELWNETLRKVVESEMMILLLKSKKPDEVVFARLETVKGLGGAAGMPMMKNYTASEMLKSETEKWRGNLETLEEIKKMLLEYARPEVEIKINNSSNLRN